MDSNKKIWLIVIIIIAILGGFYISGYFNYNSGFSNKPNNPDQQSQSQTSSNDSFDLAPDFEIKLTDGTTEKLSSLKGKTVLLNFWSVDCPPCLAEIKDIEEVYKKANNNLQVIGVATDRASADETLKVLANNGGSYPIMVDDHNFAFALYGIRATPTTIIINPKGEIVARHIGAATDAQLTALVEKASKA